MSALRKSGDLSDCGTGSASRASDVEGRLLRLAFAVVPPLGVLGLFLPFVLLALSPPFPYRLLGTAAFFLACLEKFWAMYLRVRKRGALVPERDWTAVTVGLSHTLIMYAAIIEFYARRRQMPFVGATAAGLVIYTAGLGLRHWALRELGHQWAVHVDKAIENRFLVRTGPYRWIRHPVYLAACMEVAGIPLILNAFWTTVAGLAVFIPAELSRMRFEERHLLATFGRQYEEYRAEVGGLLPRWRRGRLVRPAARHGSSAGSRRGRGRYRIRVP